MGPMPHMRQGKKSRIFFCSTFVWEVEKGSHLIPDLLSEGHFHIIIFTEFHDQADH